MPRGVKNPSKPSGSSGYSSPFGSILNGLMEFLGLDNLWNKLSGNALSDAELQANEFNAEQAQITRDFNAAEAEKQRQWEEHMMGVRYQKSTADMAAAGLNPAMMYGSGASPASVPSGSAASAGAASSASSGEPSGGLLDTLLRAVMTSVQVGNVKANTRLQYAQADQATQQANYIGMQSAWFPALSQKTIEQVNAGIRKDNASADLDAAKTAHENVLTAIDKIEESFRPLLLSTRATLESEQSEAAKAEAAAAFARAAVDKLEAAYMEKHNARMGSSELVTVAEYILDALGTDSKQVVQTVVETVREVGDSVDMPNPGTGQGTWDDRESLSPGWQKEWDRLHRQGQPAHRKK